ncbi:hypothetical protein ACE7GA_09530 [Roseomonas sp. CCTCC AB2023176]|uniref:hypothetical protein n=1 Tax=Roseomonas sp. CCTCC AB2023176 TaxID=3342640 RepID=UPI0035DD845F
MNRAVPPLLAALLVLTACGPGPSQQQAADVLNRVLEEHRATIDGLGRPSAAGPPRLEPPRRLGAGGTPAAASALLGQAPDAILAALGTPTLRRPDGDAEVWLYLGAHCALDLVLYRAGGTPRVAYAAARANSTEPRTESACLREVAGSA